MEDFHLRLSNLSNIMEELPVKIPTITLQKMELTALLILPQSLLWHQVVQLILHSKMKMNSYKPLQILDQSLLHLAYKMILCNILEVFMTMRIAQLIPNQ